RRSRFTWTARRRTCARSVALQQKSCNALRNFRKLGCRNEPRAPQRVRYPVFHLSRHSVGSAVPHVAASIATRGFGALLAGYGVICRLRQATNVEQPEGVPGSDRLLPVVPDRERDA